VRGSPRKREGAKEDAKKLVGVDDALQAVFEDEDVEVDEQSELVLQRLKATEGLSTVYARQRVDALKFKHKAIAD